MHRRDFKFCICPTAAALIVNLAMVFRMFNNAYDRSRVSISIQFLRFGIEITLEITFQILSMTSHHELESMVKLNTFCITVYKYSSKFN